MILVAPTIENIYYAVFITYAPTSYTCTPADKSNVYKCSRIGIMQELFPQQNKIYV